MELICDEKILTKLIEQEVRKQLGGVKSTVRRYGNTKELMTVLNKSEATVITRRKEFLTLVGKRYPASSVIRDGRSTLVWIPAFIDFCNNKDDINKDSKLLRPYFDKDIC